MLRSINAFDSRFKFGRPADTWTNQLTADGNELILVLKVCSKELNSSLRCVVAGHSRSSLNLGNAGYSRLIVAFRGRSCDDPPTRMLYSPGTNVHPSFASSNIDKYLGSIFTVTVFLSPASSLTLL